MKKQYSFKQPGEKGTRINILLIAAVAIIGLILISMFVLETLSKNNIKKADLDFKINITEDKDVSKVCDDSCYFALGVGGVDAPSCTKIINDSLRQNCYGEIADKSYEACLSLIDNGKKTSCIINHAQLKKDINVCDVLEDEIEKELCIKKADNCYFEQGYKKNLCNALENENYEFCKGNETCILDYTMQTGDTNGCGILSNIGKKTACLGVATKDDTCIGLAYPSQRDQCKEVYAIWTNQSFLCDDIDKDSTYAISCYSHFAINENNKNYCSKIKFENSWDCYTNYALATKDVSGCIAIHELAQFSKRGCFVNFAKEIRDPSACSYINDSSSEINCYIVSIQYNTTKPIPPPNCVNVKLASWKDKCYSYSAVGNSERLVCEEISSSSEKLNCYAKFK
ncbi:hypothetical protein HYT84_01770 [Candidatus Micrarchaeota archaeon]|nr:hypothetical protein [Candidatus Micrarchaeota archaeon]